MERFNFENLKTLIRKPTRFYGVVSMISTIINQFYFSHFYNNHGTRIMEEDWDNLVILDACRYDMFPSDLDIEGELSYKISRGSNSIEFIKQNFLNGKFHDTVYISANPHIYALNSDTFHAVESVIENGWDPDQETVPPKQVFEEVVNAIDKYPNKRYIIHFMQPHYPFIGPTGKKISQAGFSDLDSADDDDTNLNGRHIWLKLQYNLGVGKDTVWEAYQENLDIVIPYVEQLLSTLDGKTVITSDHGNLVGDRMFPVPAKGYGHPGGIHVESLIKVPWYTVTSKERRKITSDPPVKLQSSERDELKEQLKSLGYR